MPKLHVVDTGLARWLPGIRPPDRLGLRPRRGSLSGSWVVAEILERRLHGGPPPDLFHVRDRKGREIALMIRSGPAFTVVEVKAGRTVVPETAMPLAMAGTLIGAPVTRRLRMQGGDEPQSWTDLEVVPWSGPPGAWSVREPGGSRGAGGDVR